MNQESPKINRVELSCYQLPLHCLFCGQRIIDNAPEAEPSVTPCSHALFVAHDEGFEFRSERFDRLKGITGVPDDEVEIGELGYDGFTDDLEIKDAVKVAVYIPAPSFFGAYYGFAPLESE